MAALDLKLLGMMNDAIALFCFLFFLAFLAMPFAYFYFEEESGNADDTARRVRAAIMWTLGEFLCNSPPNGPFNIDWGKALCSSLRS